MKLLLSTLLVASGFNLFIGLTQAISASRVFETIPAGKPGSCSSYNIDQVATDALTLAQSALVGLTNLLRGDSDVQIRDEPNLLRSSNEQSMYRGTKASQLWGIELVPYGNNNEYFKVHPEDVRILRKAMSNFIKVRNMLTSSTHEDRKMVCGSDDLKWVTKFADIGDTSKERRNGQQRLFRRFPGVYLTQYWSPKLARRPTVKYDYNNLISMNLDGFTGEPYCPSGRMAATTWNLDQYVMLCEAVFSRPTLEAAYAAQTNLRPGYGITGPRMLTGGSELLHEMMHLLYPKRNPNDPNEEENPNRIGDYIIPQYGVKAYDWAPSCFAARENEALRNADNYRMWAMAMHFDKVNWDVNGEVP